MKMASIGKGARDKGARFEREIAKILKDKFGVDVKRTGAQERWKVHGGDVNAPKYVDTILNDFFWECKARESWSIIDWYLKAVDDVQTNQTPIVVATKNNHDNYVFLSLQDFLKIIYELDGYRKEAEMTAYFPAKEKD